MFSMLLCDTVAKVCTSPKLWFGSSDGFSSWEGGVWGWDYRLPCIIYYIIEGMHAYLFKEPKGDHYFYLYKKCMVSFTLLYLSKCSILFWVLLLEVASQISRKFARNFFSTNTITWSLLYITNASILFAVIVKVFPHNTCFFLRPEILMVSSLLRADSLTSECVGEGGGSPAILAFQRKDRLLLESSSPKGAVWMMRRYWVTDRIQQATSSMEEAENEAKNEARVVVHCACVPPDVMEAQISFLGYP